MSDGLPKTRLKTRKCLASVAPGLLVWDGSSRLPTRNVSLAYPAAIRRKGFPRDHVHSYLALQTPGGNKRVGWGSRSGAFRRTSQGAILHAYSQKRGSTYEKKTVNEWISGYAKAIAEFWPGEAEALGTNGLAQGNASGSDFAARRFQSQ